MLVLISIAKITQIGPGWQIGTMRVSKALHTAGLDSIFIQIHMDAPPGVPRMSKEPEGHKDHCLDVFLR